MHKHSGVTTRPEFVGIYGRINIEPGTSGRNSCASPLIRRRLVSANFKSPRNCSKNNGAFLTQIPNERTAKSSGAIKASIYRRRRFFARFFALFFNWIRVKVFWSRPKQWRVIKGISGESTVKRASEFVFRSKVFFRRKLAKATQSLRERALNYSDRT